MTDRIFIDSNVWLYSFLRDDCRKQSLAERFIEDESYSGNPVISWQVINEVTRVLHKNHFAEPLIRQIIENMCRICIVQDFSQEIILSASALREQYMLSFWDSLIIACALAADCRCLASEDMQDNLKIEGQLSIRNPFK
jgi:predicted nucleic acid-binding protein